MACVCVRCGVVPVKSSSRVYHMSRLGWKEFYVGGFDVGLHKIGEKNGMFAFKTIVQILMGKYTR